MRLSPARFTFAAVVLGTAGIVWWVETTEKETRNRMRQGPERDRERIEAKIKVMFKEKLEEITPAAAAGQEEKVDQ
ncbi:hypothetical protein FOA52_008441 [Chlamydomonas sp. UWO 241]|nr:hypothetical protein FOA52_008441 [Chlamydomonas sp. UWO 241]